MTGIVRCLFWGVALLGAITAQVSPPRSLGHPDRKYPESFTAIAGIRELRDGRVIVVDPREPSITVVDLISGTSKNVGRVGSGPGEYRVPLRLLPLPGDSSAVEDMAGFRRLLIVTPNGEAGGTFSVPNPDNAGNPEAADSQGRLYSYYGAPRDGKPLPDSVHIVRWDRASGRRDTVATLNGLVVSPLQLPRAAGPAPPFWTRDQWAVARDGRVAVVSVDPYRVTFFHSDGSRTTGPPLPVEPVPLAEGHKQEWREKNQRLVPGMARYGDGPIQTKWFKSPFKEPAEWPKYLPAFLPGAASFGPDGMLWVQRTTAAGAAPAFDVLNRDGTLAMRVILPKHSRLLGFGERAVYVARIDEDDLEYLERYGLPTH